MGGLRLLMAASEAGPYVRTGGLGDVMGALPLALGQLGHQVKVVLPRYASIDNSVHHLSSLIDSLAVPDNGHISHAVIERDEVVPGQVEYLFVGNRDYFGTVYFDNQYGCVGCRAVLCRAGRQGRQSGHKSQTVCDDRTGP